jgi:hypothetical protein
MSIDVEYAIKQDIRNNPVVREVDRQQKREFLRNVAVTALIVGMLLFSAWQHFKIVFNGYAVEQLRQQYADVVSLNRQLRLTLDALRAPQVVEQRATRELHMTEPTAADTVILERAVQAPPAKSVVAEVR